MDKKGPNRNGRWQDLVNTCIEAYEDICNSSYRNTKVDVIKESHRIYNQIEQPTDFPWKNASNIVLPYLTMAVDQLEPRMASSFIGKEPYIRFEPTGVSEPDELTNFLEEWWNNELKNTIKLESNTSTICHKALLEGTVFCLASYDNDYIFREDYVFSDDGVLVKVDEEGEPLTVEVKDRVFQGGKIEFIPFNDIYIKDDEEDWEKADIIRVVRPTYAELKILEEEEDGYFNIGEWLIAEEAEQMDGNAAQEAEDVQFTGNKIIECLEYHVSYVYKEENQNKEDITDWHAERYIALIAKDSETLIRMIPLKSVNMLNEHVIRRIRFNPEYSKSYGTSLYEKMKSVQDGASDAHNLFINCSYISIIPWFLYSNKTGLPENMEIHPGQGVQVDDPASVKFPNFGNNPNSFISVLNVWKELWEKQSSIGNLQLGQPIKGNTTATEIMTIVNEGNIKANYQMNVMKREFVSLLKVLYDLYYKNMAFEQSFVYHGEEIRIPRKEMRRPTNFVLTGSTDLSNTVLELRKNEQLYGTLRQDPIANPVALLEDLIKSFKPDSNPQKYINPEINQVIQQYMQQKEMEAQQQAAQQQGGMPQEGPPAEGPPAEGPPGGPM